MALLPGLMVSLLPLPLTPGAAATAAMRDRFVMSPPPRRRRRHPAPVASEESIGPKYSNDGGRTAPSCAAAPFVVPARDLCAPGVSPQRLVPADAARAQRAVR